MDATEGIPAFNLALYERFEQPDAKPVATKSGSLLDLNSYFNSNMGVTLAKRYCEPLWKLGRDGKEIAKGLGRPENYEVTRQMLKQVPEMIGEVTKNLGLPEPKNLPSDSSITGFSGDADECGHLYIAVGRVSLEEARVKEIIANPASNPRWIDCFPDISQGVSASLIGKFNALKSSERRAVKKNLQTDEVYKDEAKRFVNTRTHFADGEQGYLFGGSASVLFDGHQNLKLAIGPLPTDELLVQTWNARTTPWHAFDGTLQWSLIYDKRDPNALYWACIGAGRGWGLPADKINNVFVCYAWKTMADVFVFKHKNGIAGESWKACDDLLRQKNLDLWRRRRILGTMAMTGFGTALNRIILDWPPPDAKGEDEVRKSMTKVAQVHGAPFAEKPTKEWKPSEVAALDRVASRGENVKPAKGAWDTEKILNE